ncbi:hypothetical protein LXG23DRAFT_39192 [Yarrowia lipolytica]|nr:hypothetical protein BKA91DRAFT_129588 [Yarrowia lipolytica]KAE8169124.1 hypothetical protein BKA90DRAFT_131865 [Yarrowia lipolytica]KAJ8051483.1 hypothetical protein LXG23DRAFT_39192 [Yarrowia lipolytica]RMI97163.1 hypothetical protein BD777DRAFT_136326 [Yarrowia lipolytica]
MRRDYGKSASWSDTGTTSSDSSSYSTDDDSHSLSEEAPSDSSVDRITQTRGTLPYCVRNTSQAAQEPESPEYQEMGYWKIRGKDLVLKKESAREVLSVRDTIDLHSSSSDEYDSHSEYVPEAVPLPSSLLFDVATHITKDTPDQSLSAPGTSSSASSFHHSPTVEPTLLDSTAKEAHVTGVTATSTPETQGSTTELTTIVRFKEPLSPQKPILAESIVEPVRDSGDEISTTTMIGSTTQGHMDDNKPTESHNREEQYPEPTLDSPSERQLFHREYTWGPQATSARWGNTLDMFSQEEFWFLHHAFDRVSAVVEHQSWNCIDDPACIMRYSRSFGTLVPGRSRLSCLYDVIEHDLRRPYSEYSVNNSGQFFDSFNNVPPLEYISPISHRGTRLGRQLLDKDTDEVYRYAGNEL